MGVLMPICFLFMGDKQRGRSRSVSRRVSFKGFSASKKKAARRASFAGAGDKDTTEWVVELATRDPFRDILNAQNPGLWGVKYSDEPRDVDRSSRNLYPEEVQISSDNGNDEGRGTFA